MKNFFIWLLATLKGKKTTIGSLLALTNTYLMYKGFYTEVDALYINSGLVILGLIANVADNKLNINANKQFGK